MTVRAKFTCSSMKKYLSSHWNPETKQSEFGFCYEYTFGAVTDRNGENESFFASTPSGSLSLSAVRNDLFEPGKSYYLDFNLAE